MGKFNYEKECSRIRREQEIALHGKQISLRKARVFKSKKQYDRKKWRLTVSAL